MAKVTAPVEGFEGKVVGVHFVDGKAETDNPGALAYFERHGYKIAGKAAAKAEPTGEPSDKWTVDQLTAYAKENSIDLDGASKKDDILAKIEGNGLV